LLNFSPRFQPYWPDGLSVVIFGLATVTAGMLSGTIICRFPGILAVAGHTPFGAWTALLNADIPLIGGLTIALKVFRRETEASA